MIEMEECTIQVQSKGEFGEMLRMRIKHNPSGIEVEDTFPVKTESISARKVLLDRLWERLRSQKGNTYCHKCELINSPEATFCLRCNANVLTKI